VTKIFLIWKRQQIQRKKRKLFSERFPGITVLLGVRDIKGVIVKQNVKIINVLVVQLNYYVIRSAIVVYLVEINNNHIIHDSVVFNYILINK
jgi:hypothetical protein